MREPTRSSSWAIWWAAHLLLVCRHGARATAQAAAHAQDALALDPSDPWARMVYGLSPQHGGPARAGAGRAADRAQSQSELRARPHGLGWALLRAGRFDEAIVETGRALRMSPLDSFSGFYTATHGLALLAARRFEEALPFSAGVGRGVRGIPGPLQHPDQLLRPSRPDRGGAGIHRGSTTGWGPPLSLGLVRRHMQQVRALRRLRRRPSQSRHT